MCAGREEVQGMWLSEREQRRRERERAAALVGETTLGGDPAEAQKRPDQRPAAAGQQVLVIKAGQQGEAPCVAGALCGEQWQLEPGEVLIHSGEASIRLRMDGTVAVTGNMTLNGRAVMTAV